ncbi:hypothetical protein AB0C51_18850 [Streptomyces pathocidini]|uniref:Transmembrane protein n=1 Tax=Streptomyces pathocidini TaxID=1650571 RepID=A0ABW7UT19_9ACTN|nr:hypothetical protein [Streptomyces pathocidini]
MHMNRAPHLLPEDRPEFERLLGETLRTAEQRPDLAAIGRRLNAEQLRTMALAASAAIASCAAAEYQHFVRVRDELREPPPIPAHSADEEGPDSDTPAETADEDGSGAGLLAVFSVLAPVLAGTAAVIFLLVGYLLRYVNPDESVADTLVNAGWVFVALTAGAIVLAMGGLLLTALRNGSSSLRASAVDERTAEVDRAREAWRQALLERGVLPFLREALADPAGARGAEGAYGGDPRFSAGRTPRLGYSRPGFSTESGEGGGAEEASSRPSFQSPGYSSPDYGGPEHQPD